METINLSLNKDQLYDVWRQCVAHRNLSNVDLSNLKRRLLKILKPIWVYLATDKLVDVESWLVCSKIGVISLYFNCDSFDIFCETVRFLCMVNEESTQLCINVMDININLNISSPNSFKVAVLNGIVNFLVLNTNLYRNDMEYIYKEIYVLCHKQTRHSQLNLQLLVLYVQAFGMYLETYEHDKLLNLAYYNLEKKDSLALFRYVVNKMDILTVQTLFNYIVSFMPWKYKQKYVLLNELISTHASLISFVPHEDFVGGLIYAQSVPFLSSSAVKLYTTIFNTITESVWEQEYFPPLYEIIVADNITSQKSNILKFYFDLPFQRYPDCFSDVIDWLLDLEVVPVYSALHLLIVGMKYFLNEECNIDFAKIIRLGIDNANECCRNMTFHVLCTFGYIDNENTYLNVQYFITFNLNDANSASRDKIRNSYDKFINSVIKAITHVENVYMTVPVIHYASKFFNWLISFLLNQFTRFSCYQRISLSVILLKITLTTFSSKLESLQSNQKLKLQKFIDLISELKHLKNDYQRFIDILIICDMEESEKIFDMMFSEVNVNSIESNKISEILDSGLIDICSNNKEIADRGNKLVDFVLRVKADNVRITLKTLKHMRIVQWDNLKESALEDIIINNPLHPLLLLTIKSIHLYDTEEYNLLMLFLEDVIPNLLEVFEVRTGLPFTGNCCKGISLAFENENSYYHTTTVNALWLVLKYSCKLSSLILKIVKTDDYMRRTLNLVYSVIRRCYHKGVLEVAGEIISDVVSSATRNDHNIHVIDEFLSKILINIPLTTGVTSSVRRDAETRVMLSSIAVSDRRLFKPLFHKAIKYLVQRLKSCLEENIEDHAAVHSLVLHCLEPLISDTAVETHIVEYLTDITISTLKCFDCENWKVRNAALQTFGAVSNKLLGNNLSSNEDTTQHSAICIEELFFKYPNIYSYLLSKLQSPTLDHSEFVPIFTFLGRSYVRGDSFILKLETSGPSEISHISYYTYDFIFNVDNVRLAQEAASAYTAVSFYKDIVNNIIQIGNNLGSISLNKFYSLFYTIKMLSDKLVDDLETLPEVTYGNEKSKLLENLNIIINRVDDSRPVYKMISQLMLYQQGMTAIDLNDLERHYSLIFRESKTTVELPLFSQLIENKITYVFTNEIMYNLVNLAKNCLLNSPILLKTVCLKTLSQRAMKCKDTKTIIESELINSIVEIFYNFEYIHERFVIDECINLLLLLNLSNLSESFKDKFIIDIDNFKNNIIPSNFMPIFCYVYLEFFKDQQNVKEFFYFCIEQCYQSLVNDDYDIITLKSVIFVCKYAHHHKDTYLMIKILKMTYKMLQIGESSLHYECTKIILHCFKIKPKHQYAAIVDIITSSNILQIMTSVPALQYLIEIYTEPDSEEFINMNVFDQKYTLSVETYILRDTIKENILHIFHNINLEEFRDFLVWFKEYQKNRSDNKHVTSLVALFASR